MVDATSLTPRSHPRSHPRGFPLMQKQEFLEEPILCSDGRTYERVMIEEMFSRFQEQVIANPQAVFKSPVLGSAMPDASFTENKFAKRAIAEFALQYPDLIEWDAEALDTYKRWRRERDERQAAEEAEEEQDIAAEPVRPRGGWGAACAALSLLHAGGSAEPSRSADALSLLRLCAPHPPPSTAVLAPVCQQQQGGGRAPPVALPGTQHNPLSVKLTTRRRGPSAPRQLRPLPPASPSRRRHSASPHGVLRGPAQPELGEIFVVEVPRQSGMSTDMYYVSEDLTATAEERRAARDAGARPVTLRSINELSRHLAGARRPACPQAAHSTHSSPPRLCAVRFPGRREPCLPSDTLRTHPPHPPRQAVGTTRVTPQSTT